MVEDFSPPEKKNAKFFFFLFFLWVLGLLWDLKKSGAVLYKNLGMRWTGWRARFFFFFVLPVAFFCIRFRDENAVSFFTLCMLFGCWILCTHNFTPSPPFPLSLFSPVEVHADMIMRSVLGHLWNEGGWN